MNLVALLDMHKRNLDVVHAVKLPTGITNWKNGKKLKEKSTELLFLIVSKE